MIRTFWESTTEYFFPHLLQIRRLHRLSLRALRRRGARRREAAVDRPVRGGDAAAGGRGRKRGGRQGPIV